VAQLGRLDIVCANAGICTIQAWDEVTPQVWQDTLDTNLTGVWNTMVAATPHLITAGGGSIICTSSTAGIKGLPYLAPGRRGEARRGGDRQDDGERAGVAQDPGQHGPPDRGGHPDGHRPGRPGGADRA
jgi:NAD(P)-dependent dehydrogenase (short-subunit alcohol dehydrogenase family)